MDTLRSSSYLLDFAYVMSINMETVCEIVDFDIDEQDNRYRSLLIGELPIPSNVYWWNAVESINSRTIEYIRMHGNGT